MDKAPVSELVCTRISHDLIGNIGAVANAVELLEEGDMDFIEEIKEILKTSSGVLSSRLKFFRMVFGLNNANLSDKDLVEKTTQDYLKSVGNKNFPIILNFGDYSIKFARIMMLSVMIMADVTIKGGEINVFEQNCKLFVNISAVSKVSAPKTEDIKALLSGQKEEYLAQYAPVFYLRDLIKSSDMQICISETEAFGFVIG